MAGGSEELSTARTKRNRASLRCGAIPSSVATVAEEPRAQSQLSAQELVRPQLAFSAWNSRRNHLEIYGHLDVVFPHRCRHPTAAWIAVPRPFQGAFGRFCRYVRRQLLQDIDRFAEVGVEHVVGLTQSSCDPPDDVGLLGGQLRGDDGDGVRELSKQRHLVGAVEIQ